MNSTPEPKPITAIRLDALSASTQLANRRDAASRCEPFECGHRDPLDCTAAGCGEQTDKQSVSPDPEPEDTGADALTELWANAKIAWSARDFPKYGSQAWIALTPDDPRRLAGALEAAEMWRRYGDEEELADWLKRLGHRPNLFDTRSRAELDEAAKPKPPHQLQATASWPPIAVPGKPGTYLTHTQQRQEAA